MVHSGVGSRAPVPSDVDMSLDLSITGQRSSLPPRKSRSAYRFKASNSFVDEALFGSSVGKVDPALHWTIGTPGQESHLHCPEEKTYTASSATARTACSPVGTPRKKTQYRVKSRSPSYCDESLFGPKIEDCGWEAPWVKKEDCIRIRPLLWSPPPVMRPHSSKSNTNQIPVRAIHPPDDRNTSLGTHKGTRNFWKPPESDSDSGGCPSVGDPPASAKARWSSPRKDTPRSASCSGRLTARRGFLTERPAWK
ncbi:RBPJ-interacting and tubulin-associated protein 1 isoform X1 [Bufo bufo]|uniref:RBPJ-interacting and tubulin-associated protein 1 isoform X1 n=2 Tax=Bufo bufo TaxID=8384 RepID=UPI001ABE9090|nr:RBPJ-interacting and tubulin-associated protein 1 isoform X1 [Bufo bufo]